MSKNDKTMSLRHVAAGIALGTVATLALSALLVMFMALPVASGRVGEDTGRSIVVVCAFVSAVVGAIAARIKNGGAALISGAGTALAAVLIRLLIGLISDDPHTLDGTDLAICLATLCGGIGAGAVTIRRRKRRR